MSKQNIKIGITQGDMNGIGYEVILKTLNNKEINELCTPILYGSSKAIAYHRKALNIDDFNMVRIKTPEEANPKKSNIINCLDDNLRIELGKSTYAAGEASLKVLERATKDLRDNKLDALITAPINKHNIQSDKFQFPGHTEYLRSFFEADEVLMLMVNRFMRIGVVAGHVPIAEVASHITPENITNKINIMNNSLIRDFGIRKPKIAVLGLNPHCGDNGVIGKEEEEIITPTLEKLRNENLSVFGPFAADGFFGSENYLKFDGVLAMYHDQGLAPFKTTDLETGVNFTAGLPVIRTSPAHGTAYEIAGLNKANPSSFRHALYLAIDIYRNKNNLKQLSKDPLEPVDINTINE